MRIFDSHCHIDDKSFNKDRDQVIKNARKANVTAMMIVGINQRSSEEAVNIAKKYPNIFASVGIHPHDAKNCSEELLQSLQVFAKDDNVKAWGETGLDFNRMFSPQEDQENCFCRQMEIAKDLELPLIFHERDSNGRFLEILKQAKFKKRKGVVHCFSGNKKELLAYLDLGYHIGITGIFTIHKRGQKLRSLIEYIPKERILVETDAPYLTPAPEKNRTRRNEPAFVKSTLLKIAQELQENPNDLAEVIWKNTCDLYDLQEISDSF